MPPFLARHAALIYLAGALLVVAGGALALGIATLAGAIIGGVLGAVGLTCMAATHDAVGA